MRYIRYKATAKPGTEEAEKYEGAYVSCWIKRRSKAEAISVAERMIRDFGWLPLHIEANHLVTREGYKGQRRGAEALRYFDQASIDGEVLVFHTWPWPQSNSTSEGSRRK